MRRAVWIAWLAAVGWGAPPAYRLSVPKGFPRPRIPLDNPLTADKVRLGRYLFYDKRLSVNGTTSCATCHRQELAFTDGRAQALGATGQTHPRSSMSLVNVAYTGAFNWSNPTVHSLEEQALKPMFGTDPVELGVVREDLLRLVRSDPVYRVLFPRAFDGEANPYRIVNVTKALASFERTILSGGSPYDRFHMGGDADAIPDAARRGEILFFLDYGGPACFRCHGGFNFSDAVDYAARPHRPVEFHNTGLYNVAAIVVSRAQFRALRAYEEPVRRGQVQGADAAQHRAHRSLHARRKHCHAGRSSGSLCGGRPHPRARAVGRRGEGQSGKRPARPRISHDRAKSDGPSRLPGKPDG